MLLLQATFILLGFLSMVGLEYVEISGSQTRQQQQQQQAPPSTFLGSSPAWTCLMEGWDPAWDPPLNLTCVAGVLRQS